MRLSRSEGSAGYRHIGQKPRWHAHCINAPTMRALIRLASLLCIPPILNGCAPMLAMVGTNATWVQVVAQVERVKLAGDGASFLSSDKTITDHAISKVTGKECKIFNILTHESVCTQMIPAMATDSNMPLKEVAAGASPATPDNQSTAHNAPSIDVSSNQASGD